MYQWSAEQMELAQARELLELAISAAQGAGDLIRRHYRSAYDAWEKSPNNPVTTADLEANDYLRRTLTAATPDYGWLSEETVDNRKRLDKSYSWIVDPLDGTQEFIQGVDQFAVSVALVENEVPLLGVVHNPVTEETMAGIVGEGITYNGAPARLLSDRTEIEGARVLVSDTEVSQGMWIRYQTILDLQQLGSAAYKLGRTAAGFGDAYISLKPKHEWDLCAGVALLLAAGGQTTDLAGRPLRFNQADVVINGVAAANPTLHANLMRLLRSDTMPGSQIPPAENP